MGIGISGHDIFQASPDHTVLSEKVVQQVLTIFTKIINIKRLLGLMDLQN
jgi:hypothetical protein